MHEFKQIGIQSTTGRTGTFVAKTAMKTKPVAQYDNLGELRSTFIVACFIYLPSLILSFFTMRMANAPAH